MELSKFIEDFENLPKSIQHQLIEYAEFLISKSKQRRKLKKVRNTFTFSWENGLDELKELYSSVELQHKINELRK
jgi:hypothetical protein